MKLPREESSTKVNCLTIEENWKRQDRDQLVTVYEVDKNIFLDQEVL